ncbi:MAG: hypothetical protein H7067_01660 [Burkholderiales bacterium]|nr:hypothetical protein [Opitutaceae bacterium]
MTPPRPTPRRIHQTTTARRRGSVLIVALLVAALIALVLGSYLSLNLGTARLARRTFDRGAAFHLAEAGLEEGLWTYNRVLSGDVAPWLDWAVSGDAAWRRIDGFRLGGSTTGTIKIYASPVSPADGARPTVVALASVQSAGGAPVTQMIETTLRRRSFFGAGLVARERLVFRGRNTTFDSWDSDPDQNPATPAVPYSAAVAKDTGSVATGALDNSNAVLNQARIHGYFHTSGLEPDLGDEGFIGPFGVEAGEIDPARFSKNFHADFPAIVAPVGGVFIKKFGPTLGTPGVATSWRATSLVLGGSDTLTILGDVTLVLTDPLKAISIGGNADLIIPIGASLTLYAEGDMLIGGKGVLNANPSPASLQFWSTATSARPPSISIVGRGALACVLYAPEGDVSVNGNGVVAGAIVARRLAFTGNAAFHYDLALARLGRHAPYRADGWRTVDDPVKLAALRPLLDH